MLDIIEAQMELDHGDPVGQNPGGAGYKVSMSTIERARIRGWTFRDNNFEDRWVHNPARKPSDVFIQESWTALKPKAKGEASLQSDGVGRHLVQGSNKQHLPLELLSKQHGLPRGDAHSPLAVPSKAATRCKAPARQRSLPHLKSNSKPKKFPYWKLRLKALIRIQ